nr:MAG TPA: hypothetical protein [Caudoviricetes sp.]
MKKTHDTPPLLSVFALQRFKPILSFYGRNVYSFFSVR